MSELALEFDVDSFRVISTVAVVLRPDALENLQRCLRETSWIATVVQGREEERAGGMR